MAKKVGAILAALLFVAILMPIALVKFGKLGVNVAYFDGEIEITQLNFREPELIDDQDTLHFWVKHENGSC